ncbi:hypothetical protein PSHT_07035 [Puccinia striiformis]|uniref:Uncharacterized protein n=2 Tax=Puccinia striiformis TaxID=27350 RepID=A0A2S4W736_9BASI|nr:hypothetical protein PSHT_07035 [Puccinia striiformis]POW17585.1 hypothetical protein PSTT_00301 [Puccinia striiformis]
MDNVDRMITTDLNAYITGVSIPKVKKVKAQTQRKSTKRPLADPEDLRLYKRQMRDTVDELHLRGHSTNRFYDSTQLFREEKLELVALNADKISDAEELELLIGGEMIDGQLDALMQLTRTFQNRVKPAPISNKTAAASRAEAATQAISQRITNITVRACKTPRRTSAVPRKLAFRDPSNSKKKKLQPPYSSALAPCTHGCTGCDLATRAPLAHLRAAR